MSITRLDPADAALLDRVQRDFPLSDRPFADIGARLGLSEDETLTRLTALRARGAITRVGGVRRAEGCGASTLAAIAAPEDDVEDCAAIIGAQPGVNHNYLRENPVNLWFVATGPDRAHVDRTLAAIAQETGRAVIDLPLARPYHIDLGFSLIGGAKPPPPPPLDRAALRPDDDALVQALCDGLTLVQRPYAALADALGRPEDALRDRIAALLKAGALTRLGVVVRHRALGFTANAMVCFDPPEDRIDEAGAALARAPGVNLAYRRRPHERWPYPLFCMIHARSRGEALELLLDAMPAAGLEGAPRAILFSLRCFKQRGALVSRAAVETAA